MSNLLAQQARMRRYRAAKKNEERMGRTNNYRYQLVCPGEVQGSCESPDHRGDSALPIWEFAHWTTDLGRTHRATWCEVCIMRWIEEHGGDDGHGQNPYADESARLRMYERRVGGESEAENHAEAVRLMARRVG